MEPFFFFSLHCTCSCCSHLCPFYPPSLIVMLINRSTCYLSSLLATVLLTLVATSPYLWSLITYVSISRYRIPLDLDDSSHIALL